MIHFSFETNGKLMVLGVPTLRHFRVVKINSWHRRLSGDEFSA